MMTMINSNPTETRIASVYKDENEIITVTMKDCGVIDEFDIMDLNLVIRHKSENKPALKMVLSLAEFDLSKKAKLMAKKEENLSKTKARAIVVSNLIKASLFNFFKQFSKKGYPQQFFKNKEEAYAWLMTLK